MSKYFICIVAFLVTVLSAQSQSFQDQFSPIEKIIVDISPESYKGIFREYEDDIYYPITILLNTGDSLEAKMRVRGDSSRKRKKKSLKIKLIEKNQAYSQSKVINLNAEYSDPIYMRQFLASKVYNTSGQPSYRTKHIELYINHEFQGIYLWIEPMDKHFLRRNGLDPKGNLYKATFDGATLSTHDNLYKNWEKKTNKKDTKIDDLVKMRNELNSVSNDEYYDWVKSTFDYDNLVNALAVNMLISNSSTYYHNYYLYHDLTKDKWFMLPWDMDETFKLKYLDMHYQRGSWGERNSAKMEGNPLLERSIINKKMLADIQNRISELQGKIVTIEKIEPVIDSLAAIISPFIGKEKIVSKEISIFNQDVLDLKQFIQKRYDKLQEQFSQNPTSFHINQPQTAFSGDVTLSWERSIDPNGDSLVYTIIYSKREDFDSRTYKIRNIIGNKIVIDRSRLSPGKYFFMVSVTDGNETIFGYHSKHSFWVMEE